jgi:DNA-binding CsgD family transcriptional regulator
VQDAALHARLAVLVSPLPCRLADGHGGLSGRVPGGALILLRDLCDASGVPDPALLRRLFGLTRAEAEVAYALYGGATKGAAAAMRGLRESTIRSQVDATLLKTGTANVRDLERLLASLRYSCAERPLRPEATEGRARSNLIMSGPGTPETLRRWQQSSRNQTFRKVNGLHCLTPSGPSTSILETSRVDQCCEC